MYKMRILDNPQRILLATFLGLAAAVVFLIAVALPFVGIY
jgi:hypothetical protein